MALGTQRVSAVAAPGMAAAATAHAMSGARGVASAQQSPIEAPNYSSQVGVNDNAILYQDQNGGLNPDDKGRQSYQQGPQTPFMARSALIFVAGSLDGSASDATPELSFGPYVTRSIQGYERAQNLINSPWAPQGSTINQMS